MDHSAIYNSRDIHCKTPYGAVPSGTHVRFTLRPPRSAGFSHARLIARFESRGEQVLTFPMEWEGIDLGRDLFTGTLDTMEYDAASADLHAVFHNVPRSLDMGTASGDMDITLPDGAGFTAEVDAMSGDFRSDFEYSQRDDRYISGDGSCRIDLSAMSGDVTIRKGE